LQVSTRGRSGLERLVAELDAFYGRGAVWLGHAARDRDRVPELDAFLRHVDAGVGALVREAVGPGSQEATIRLVTALADVSVWRSLKRLKSRRLSSRARCSVCWPAQPLSLRRIRMTSRPCRHERVLAPPRSSVPAGDSPAGR
jgi:hypothetical protein